MTQLKLRSTRRAFFVLAGLSLAAAVGISREARSEAAPDLVIIVNAANSTGAISASDLRDFYVGEKTEWPGGVPVKLFSRGAEPPAAISFFKNVLHMAPSRFRRHWQERTFAGRPGLPPEDADDAAAIVKKVSGSPGGIGYLSKDEAGAVTGGAKVLTIQ